MLYVVFSFLLLLFVWRLIPVVMKAALSITRSLFIIVLCPLILIVLVFFGLVYLAVPLLMLGIFITLMCPV